jgi:tetratricopeptide (TPR) repeat protein
MDTGTPEPASNAATGRRGLLRRLLPFGILLILFAAGLGMGSLLAPKRKVEEKKEETPEHFEARDVVLGPLDLRKKADRLLLAGSPVQALELLRGLKPDGRKVRAAHVHYRAGLCQEILGNTDLATAAYRQAGSEEGGDTLRPAILLAHARILFRDQRFAEARTLLQPLTLNEQDSEAPPIFRQDARFLAAFALAAEHLGSAEKSVLRETFDANRVFFAFRYVDDLPPFATPKESARKAEDHIEIHVEEGKEPRVKSARFLKKNAVEAIDAIAKACGWKAEWSEKAKARAAERALTIGVEQWTAAELVQRAADSIEVACIVEKDALRLRNPEELSATEASHYREAFAERMLQGLLRSDADHPGFGYAMLRLADLAFHRRKPAEAEAWLKRIVADHPYSNWAVPAHFGLASMRFEEGNLVAVRRHLFQAIDLAPGNDATAEAYLRIGQTLLEEGDATSAVRHLRRAQGLLAGSPLLPRATLLTVAAHLALDEPDAAQTLIAAQRPHLRKGEFERPFVFLNALTQYRVAKAKSMGRRELRDLYETAKAVGDEPILGRWGRYLQARAFLDMNLPHESLPIAESTLGSAKGPICDPLRYVRGESLAHLGRKEEAAKDFEMLESSAAEKWRRQAIWQLAQFDLENDRLDDCVRRCRLLWHDATNRGDLLQVWGEALRRQGDFVPAAKAFGGAVPE